MEANEMPNLQPPNSQRPKDSNKKIGATLIIAIVLIAIIILTGALGMGWASSFLFFGLIGVVIYLCRLIIAAIRKKDKNPSGIGIAGSAIVLIVGIILSSHSNPTTPVRVSPVSATGTSAQVQSKSVSTSSEADKRNFKVGETAKYDDVELTVTKVQKTKGGEFDSPKSGNEYVIVTIKYKNDGKDNISYNPYDFKMKNSKGQIISYTIVSDIAKDQLESGALAPGGEVEGEIVYEEPKGDKGLVLQYTGNIFSDESEVDFQLQ